MRKRMTALFLSLLLLLPVSAFTELQEEELYIEEWLDLPDEDENSVIPETDGSTTITITCTGDFTIGGDNYHHKGKKFYEELKKHGNDINFTMANVRDIFKKDDLTLVNFEGTLTESKYVPDKKKNNGM